MKIKQSNIKKIGGLSSMPFEVILFCDIIYCTLFYFTALRRREHEKHNLNYFVTI